MQTLYHCYGTPCWEREKNVSVSLEFKCANLAQMKPIQIAGKMALPKPQMEKKELKVYYIHRNREMLAVS